MWGATIKRIGKLKFRLDYQEQGTVKNQTGENIAPYATLFQVWADIEPLVGDERIWQFAKVQGIVSHKISTRYNALIKPKGQFLYNNRVFGIRAVLNIGERGREMAIMCEEKV